MSINDAHSTGDPSTVESPSDIKPTKYDNPQLVQFAGSLPPMEEYQNFIYDGKPQGYPIRVVPDAFEDLSFHAKIFYASKYGENI